MVADVGNDDVALNSSIEHRPSVLVLDLTMPGNLTALDAIPSWFCAPSPYAGIVVLTMLQDPAFERRELRLGAMAYVLKESADTELDRAVQQPRRRRRTCGDHLEVPCLKQRPQR